MDGGGSKKDDDWLGQSRRRKRARGGGEEETEGEGGGAAASASASEAKGKGKRKPEAEGNKENRPGSTGAVVDLSGPDEEEQEGAGGGATADLPSVPDGEEHDGCRARVAALEAEVAGLKQRLKDVMGRVPICSICLEEVEYPVELEDCRHLFCCQCIYSAIITASGMKPPADNEDNAYDDTTIPRACPLCRTEIHSAPKPPALAFLQHLERVKAERRRECGGAEAAGNGGVSPATRQRRQQGAEAARRVARETYQLQMDQMKGLFEAERRRRERRRRRRVRQGQEAGSEMEEDGEEAPIWDGADRVHRCPRCTWEMDTEEGGCVNPRCTNYGAGSDRSEGEEEGSEGDDDWGREAEEGDWGADAEGEGNLQRDDVPFLGSDSDDGGLEQRALQVLGSDSESSGDMPIAALARRAGRRHHAADLMSSGDEEKESEDEEGPARRRRRVVVRRRQQEDEPDSGSEKDEAPRRRRVRRRQDAPDSEEKEIEERGGRRVRRRQESEPSDEEEDEEDGRRRIRRIFQAARQQQQQQQQEEGPGSEEAEDDLGFHAGFGDEDDVYASEGEGDGEVYEDAMEGDAEEDEYY